MTTLEYFYCNSKYDPGGLCRLARAQGHPVALHFAVPQEQLEAHLTVVLMQVSPTPTLHSLC